MFIFSAATPPVPSPQDSDHSDDEDGHSDEEDDHFSDVPGKVSVIFCSPSWPVGVVKLWHQQSH